MAASLEASQGSLPLFGGAAWKASPEDACQGAGAALNNRKKRPATGPCPGAALPTCLVMEGSASAAAGPPGGQNRGRPVDGTAGVAEGGRKGDASVGAVVMVVVLEVVAVLLKTAGGRRAQGVLVLRGDAAGRVLGAAGGQPGHGRGPRFQSVIGGVSSCSLCQWGRKAHGPEQKRSKGEGAESPSGNTASCATSRLKVGQ